MLSDNVVLFTNCVLDEKKALQLGYTHEEYADYLDSLDYAQDEIDYDHLSMK